MLVFCQGTYEERIEQTKECVRRIRPHVHRAIIIVDETVSEESKAWLRNAGCEVYEHKWEDSMVIMRNQYLQRCNDNDFVIVSDPDELFCDEFYRDLPSIIESAEREGVNLLLINSHDRIIQPDGTVHESKSSYYKNLIFKYTTGVHYEGIGEVKRVHETLVFPRPPKVKVLPDKYYFVHTKYWWEIWERAARNVFIAGGGNNVGSKNPAWLKLREICSSLGLNSWHQAREYFRRGNIDPRLKEWLWENRYDGYDYEHECVTGDTLVITPEGVKRISECQDIEWILCLEHKKPTWTRVKRFIDIPLKRKLYDIALEDGRVLSITEENLVLTNEGWIPAKDLTPAKHYLVVIEYGSKPRRSGFENGLKITETILLWKRIVQKIERGEDNAQRVYDFTTETGNFFANGILIHNCMEFGRWYFEYLHPEEAEGWCPVFDLTEKQRVMRYVEEMYLRILGRHADSEGKQVYTEHILAGRIKKEDLPRILMESYEYKQRFGQKR